MREIRKTPWFIIHPLLPEQPGGLGVDSVDTEIAVSAGLFPAVGSVSVSAGADLYAP